MADRTVTVRLQAETNAFQRAMAGAAASARAVGQEISTGLDQVSSRDLTRVGGNLTRSVTLPLVGIGVAAGGMAMQFDDAFRQMQGLAGVTAEEVDGLKASVLELAGETAQSPQRLAEALYFVRSAGIDGAAAMETLEVAARGATAGLGDAGVVADVVTSALGAYGEANITAAHAGDVLVATAREGKAEAAALAPQFGRLLPIASELGVTFDEVGAGLAYLSRSGGGAELAATNLGNVLQKLLTPAEEGVTALEAMGMTTGDLRQSIQDDGLLATLVMLRTNLEANGMELGDFSRDAQFTTGVLALTRNGGADAAEVFEALANATGALGEAFDAASQGPGFSMRQSIAQIQAILIQLGDTLLPIASDILGALSTVAQAFADLPGPVQTFLLALGGMAAAAGPIATVAGHIGKLQDALTKLGPMGARAAGALGPLAVAAGVAAIAWVGYSQRQNEAKARAQEFTDAIVSQTGALEDNIDAVFARRLTDSGVVSDAVEAGAAIDDLATIARDGAGEMDTAMDVIAGSFSHIGNARAEVDDLTNALADAGLAGTPLADNLIRLAESGEYSYNELQTLLQTLSQLNGDFERGSAEADRQAAAFAALGLAADGSVPGMDGLTTAADRQVVAAEKAEEAIKNLIDTLHASTDPIFALLDAQLGVTEAQQNLAEVMADSESTLVDVARAQDGVASAAADLDSAIYDLAAGIASGDVSAAEFAATLNRWVAQGSITQGQADTLIGRFGDLAGSADVLAAKDIIIDITADTSQAQSRIGALHTQLQGLANSGVRVTVSGGAVVRSASGGYAGQGQGGPSDTIPTMLTPGEFVIKEPAARALGPQMLHALNEGQMPDLIGARAVVSGAGGGGGGTGGGPVTYINVQGSVWSMRDLAYAVGDELDRLAARGGR